MIIKNLEFQLTGIKKFEGTSKTGKPYLFYKVKLLDLDEGNIFDFPLSNALNTDKAFTTKLLQAKGKPLSADISLFPSGFSLKGTIVKLEL